MSLFAVNILLAILWAALWASWSLQSLATGFVVGFAALWVARPLFSERPRYFRRAFAIIDLFFYFLWELLISSLKVAWDVITPQDLARPALIEMPLDVERDIEILLVTNLISLTPGTLSLDVTPDRKTLIVHAMFAEDPEAIVADLKNGMERRVREVFLP